MQSLFVLAMLSAVAAAAPPTPEVVPDVHRGPPEYIIEPPDILTIDVLSVTAPAEEVVVQQVRGVCLVRPDGTLSLRRYGAVFIANQSLDQARATSERHLLRQGVNAKISLEVYAHNSKYYYVILTGDKNGDRAYRFLICGGDTVLDAIAQVPGLPAMASRKRIWVSRAAPEKKGSAQVLPVDWNGIVQRGSTATNYTLRTGDRIFVSPGPFPPGKLLDGPSVNRPGKSAPVVPAPGEND